MRYTLPLGGQRTLSLEIAWKQWKFVHFKCTASVHLKENLIKPMENEDILRGRQVCSFVYLKGKPYKTNENEGFFMRTNSNTLALVYLNGKPINPCENEDSCNPLQAARRYDHEGSPGQHVGGPMLSLSTTCEK